MFADGLSSCGLFSASSLLCGYRPCLENNSIN